MSVALEKLKIAYMPVPKAACSSVKAALAQVDPDVSYRWRRARRPPSWPRSDTGHRRRGDDGHRDAR